MRTEETIINKKRKSIVSIKSDKSLNCIETAIEILNFHASIDRNATKFYFKEKYFDYDIRSYRNGFYKGYKYAIERLQKINKP
jgi:hypothetical protein